MLANGENKKSAAADGVHINLKVKSQVNGVQFSHFSYHCKSALHNQRPPSSIDCIVADVTSCVEASHGLPRQSAPSILVDTQVTLMAVMSIVGGCDEFEWLS